MSKAKQHQKRKHSKRRSQGNKAAPKVIHLGGAAAGPVVEMPITMQPVEVLPVGPNIDPDDLDDDGRGPWSVGFGGTVAEIVCEGPTRITYAPTFAPVVHGTMLAVLVELACHPRPGTPADAEMCCSVQLAIFSRSGQPVELCDRTAMLKLKGYTRIVIALDPNQLMPKLALRAALTVSPVSAHDVHVVACALAAMRPETT